MTSAMTLVPYLLVAAYGLKLAWTGDTYGPSDAGRRRAGLACGAIATVYAASMLVFGGTKYLLLSALLYAPGTILFVMSRRERKHPAVFSRGEAVACALLVIAAVFALFALISGRLVI
jgi:arginine:ornithine antiporter/lysine permease